MRESEKKEEKTQEHVYEQKNKKQIKVTTEMSKKSEDTNHNGGKKN